MKAIFAGVTNLSLRFGAVVLALMAVISVLGVIAITRMRQELIPPIEFPQTIILTQASGMTSDQVLNVVTGRLEDALGGVADVANLESTTTGAFGSIIIARNDFGMNQERLRNEMRAAIDTVWLPLRRIQPPAGEDAQAFAARLMGDMTPDVLLYLAGRDSNFLFQLAPEAWAALPDETVRAAVTYLAGKTQGDDSTALRRLIDQEIIPALETVPQVARISISGGQVLPGENGDAAAQPAAPGEARSQLLGLSQTAWAEISAKIGAPATLDAAAVDAFNDEQVTAPQTPPALPQSWQMDRFTTARDLFEMRTLTRNLGAVFNQFVDSGEIIGGLGQTDDLSVDDLTQMLALDPTMVEYFKAEQLAALPDDVFAALPADYIASLDGLTRDALAAKALARALAGDATVPPVDLPQAWRVQQPQFVTFGFDDLPLASFTVAGNGLDAPAAAETTSATPATDDNTATETVVAQVPATNVPEGPALPELFSLMGEQLGVQLDSADDLLSIHLPESMSALAGTDTLNAAQFLGFMTFLNDPSALSQAGGGDGGTDAASQFNAAEFLPALTECGVNPLTLLGGADSLRIGDIIIGCLGPDVMSYLEQQDPTFVPDLQPAVFEALDPSVLALPEFAPPLDGVWNTLANQPQFDNAPLQNAADVLALGNGSAAQALDTIDASVPEAFSGYETRLFNSLTPATLRYFALQEPNFYADLTPDVLIKLSPDALASLPDDVTAALPSDEAATVAAIVAGDQPSAAAAQAERYATDAPPADPNAPALNADWQFVGDFMGVELDTADDLFRFFPTPINFLNGFWDTAQGIAFAPRLFGNISPEAFSYWVDREPVLLTDLRIEALQLLPENVVSSLPQDVQDRIASGELPFVPTETVTRTDGDSSLLVTVYKTSDSNTIEAFYAARNTLTAIDERDDAIHVGLAFEQASFIEESISGVAREGLLGAIFAVIMILIFLSTGVWSRRPRNLVGALLVIIFGVGLFLLVNAQLADAGGDWGRAFEKTDIVWRVMLLGGMVTGLVFLLLPAKLPYPSWRSTLVTAVSIPLSVLMAFAMMRWLSPAIHSLIAPAAEDSTILGFVLRLFPADITINIMTLSGLTVAIGRVVDDSIVVLENIFRQVQAGGDRRTAVLTGVRDVSMAIFVATLVTVVVFLPLGLTGGLIGAFFLPFGLAVTYSLVASFIVAITVVPLLAYLLLDPREIGEHKEGWLERIYTPLLRWTLDSGRNKAIVLGIALISMLIGFLLFANRPQTFLPSFGEPQLTADITLPPGTKIAETDAKVRELEAFIRDSLPEEEITRVQSVVGGSGLGLESLLLGSTGVSENTAQVTVSVEASPTQLDALAQTLRAEAVRIFGAENVSVSSISLIERGGFGGFAMVVSGPQAELEALDARVIDTLNGVPGLINVTSTLAESGGEGGTIIRIDGQSALRYSAELETENTLGVTAEAIEAVNAMPDLPADVTVSAGFESQQQTEGFRSLGVAMVIAIVIVTIILVATFQSFVGWLAIIVSIAVAPVGAAILLTLTDRVLGISAMIGLLMLIGIVVTNAVVLIDRVQSNRKERGMNVHDALMEGGSRRLRPILMTALATILALSPLAIGLSKGAIIAAELGTVVIGGLVSSTLLTLIVTPIVYSLLVRERARRAQAAAAASAGD
ncbi:MAG: efflux RND transporter permease subunit [Anaerolineae bacterium]|nr:efflux RND transporter permease subunit [Anaerolineae bacterium]